MLDAAAAPTCEGQSRATSRPRFPMAPTLVVASSVPVRALEWCMAPRDGLRVFANRGANGIDGFVSTVIGVAQASAHRRRRSVCAATSASCTTATGCSARPRPATFVVLDNDGGGIFSYLPPAELPEFEQLFGTPHGLDLVEVARAHGAHAERIDDVHKLGAARSRPATLARLAPVVRVLVVPIDRARERRAPPRALGRGRRGRSRRHRGRDTATDEPARGASARACLGLGPLGVGLASRRRCRRRRAAGRGSRRSARRGARPRTRRRRSRRPTRTARRRDRAASARVGRSPRARSRAACRPPPASGAARRARSTADVSRSRTRAVIVVARCVRSVSATGAVPRAAASSHVARERLEHRVDDEPVLARVLLRADELVGARPVPAIGRAVTS